jgi:acetyl-CoA carboxylase biotin carboxyl carrier protein
LAMIDLEELRQILELLRQHDLAELELEGEGFRIRVRKTTAGVVTTMGPAQYGFASPAPGTVPIAPPPAPSPAQPSVAGKPTPEAAELTDLELAVVKSPIVGTFYRAPEPGAPAFVEVGRAVRKGQVLCILEAMKLMNEIESEYEGEIVKVYVENGQPVQYGERLFAIRVTK